MAESSPSAGAANARVRPKTMTLKTDLVGKMTLDKFPEADVPWKDGGLVAEPNYLIHDAHRDALTGFAMRVGKKASV